MGGGKFGHPVFRGAHQSNSAPNAGSPKMCVSTGLLYFMSHTHLLHFHLFNFLLYQVVAPCTSAVGAKLTAFSALTERTFLRYSGALTFALSESKLSYASNLHRWFKNSSKLAGCNSRILICNWGLSRLLRKQSRPTILAILPVLPKNPKANSRLMSMHNDCALSPFLRSITFLLGQIAKTVATQIYYLLFCSIFLNLPQ